MKNQIAFKRDLYIQAESCHDRAVPPAEQQAQPGDARVHGDARVESQTDWLLVGPAKSSGRFTTAYRDTKIGVRVSCGCFTGTAQEFSAQIEATHAGNQQHLQQYRLFCQLIAFSFDIQPA